MAVFPSFKLTEKGEELLNRSIGEGKTLTFTKFELGDGNTPSDFRKQTGLVNKFYEFPILNTSIQKDQVLRIRGYFDNKSFSQDKQLKEIGVFVKIEGNETQYLYSYTNAGDTGDIIPANSRGFYSRTLDVANYIGYATNITFNIEQLRDRYAFNTETEMKVASYLKAGDKVELWGNLVLGDKPTDQYIIQESGEIELSNGLFAKKVSFKYVAQTIEEIQKLALKVGDIVEVLGYYQAGDGAGHKRVIADSDDGSGVQLENGLWANIVHNGEVNVSWFGLRDNDENFDINSIITKIQSIGGRVVIDKAMTLYSKSQAVLTEGIDFKCSTIINRFSIETTASKMGIFINGALENDFYIKNLTLDCGKIAGKGFGFRLEKENRINSITFDNVKVMNVENPQGSTGCDVGGIDIRGAIDNIIVKNVCIDGVDWTLGADVKVVATGITISRSTADNSVPKNILLENIICKNITEHSNNYVDPTNVGFSVEPDSDAIKVLTGQSTNLTIKNVYVELNDRYAKRAIKLQTGSNNVSNVYVKLKNANLGSIIDDQTGRNTVIDNVQVELDNSILTFPFQSITTGDSYSMNNGGYVLKNVSIFGTVFGSSYDVKNFIRSNTSSSTTVQTTRDMTIENVKIKAPLNFDVMLDYGRAEKTYGVGEFVTFKNVFVNKVNKAFYSSAYNSSVGRVTTGKMIIENFRMYNKDMITLLSPYASSNTVSAQLYTSIISSDIYVSDENVAMYGSYERVYPITINGLSAYNYSYQRLMPPDRFPCNMLIPNATALFNQTWIDISVRMESYTSSFAGQVQTWRILLSSPDSGNIVNCRVFEKEKADYSNRTLLDGLTAIYNKTTKILTIDFSTKPTSYNQWSIEIKAPFEFKFVTETAQGSDTFVATSNVVRDMSFLNTPVMMYAMEQEGGTVKEDYLNYSLEKMKYDAQIQAEEQAKYEAYELLLKENPNLTWEEFEQTYGNTSMMNRRKKRSLVERLEEPTVPESVKKFMEKYL